MTYNPQIPSQEKCCYRVINNLRSIQPKVLEKLPTACAARFKGRNGSGGGVGGENHYEIDDGGRGASDNDNDKMLDLDIFNCVEFEDNIVTDSTGVANNGGGSLGNGAAGIVKIERVDNGAAAAAQAKTFQTYEEVIQSNESKSDVLEEHKAKCSDLYVLNMTKTRKRTTLKRAHVTSYKWTHYRFRAMPSPHFIF